MKTLLILLSFALFCSTAAAAQTAPFESFISSVKAEPAGFAGNKENLSRHFNQERIRLGTNFETELWKYLGDDTEKHYWIGLFLTAPSYLHSNTPLPELSLKIWQRGVDLEKNNQADAAVGQRFSTLVLLAILAQKQGRVELALSAKNETVRITESGFASAAYLPGMGNFDRCLFQHIGGDVSSCGDEKNQPPAVKIVMRGHMQTPDEGDPRNYRSRVKVEVKIDETGNVISAVPIEGDPKYFEQALSRARKAKFAPLKLSGVPVKYQGILTYYLK